jgi:CubicO group peptidase (beta-lactamase class C family)
MITRRAFLQASGGLALSLPRRTAAADPIRSVQTAIDLYQRQSLDRTGAKVGVIAGVVTPEQPDGRFLYAGGDAMTNPFGKRLALDERTPFEIASISKVFTSGIHYMLHGPYEGTLGDWLTKLPLSRAVGNLRLENLAIYRPGLAQDNRGGVYPPILMRSLKNLFDFLATFTPPFEQGSCYAYSNLGWALSSMAALKLDHTDMREFARAYNAALVRYCNGFGARQTEVFQPDIKPRLPMGYNKAFTPLPASASYQPTSDAGCGSGGIVSNGADMMRYLLYNMGRLPGGSNDPALVYQQAEGSRAAPCAGGGAGPITSYGWFHGPVQTAQGPMVVVNKNGGVAGYTSWMGFTRWQGTSGPSTHGAFVLSNSPASTRLGVSAMRILLGV